MPTENDFRDQDLRGRSFRNHDLTGADFREADVRGADFSDARLVGAAFSGARIGVRPLAGAVVLVAALAASVAAGFMVGYFADTLRDRATASDWRDVLGGWLLVLIVLVFFGLLVVKGIRQAVWGTLIALVVLGALDFVLVYSAAGEVRFLNAAGLIGLLLLFGLAALAGVLGRIVGGTFGAWAIGIVAVIGGLAAGRAHGGLAAIVVSVVLMFISKRALTFDERDRPLQKLAHRIVTRRGTRFTRADVTGADFTNTLLTHADVSHATLDGAIWEPGTGPLIFDEDSP
jgi:MFS family permease